MEMWKLHHKQQVIACLNRLYRQSHHTFIRATDHKLRIPKAAVALLHNNAEFLYVASCLPMFLWNLSVKCNMSQCLDACLASGPGSVLLKRAEATDRCLSSTTEFIKAAPGCEDRGRLCLYPPAAIRAAKSQAWEEPAEAVSQTWPR